MTTNYLELYNLETHLLSSVGPKFHREGCLAAFDFMLIVIWKANRAKSKIAKRLVEQSGKTLDVAVKELTANIHAAGNSKARLKIMHEAGFLLPMATAILTILYPEDFTVYDVRVCEQLDGFHRLKNLGAFEKIWAGYLDFCEAVKSAVKEPLSLRDKDRWLWGQSFANQLKEDISKWSAEQ
jgi:hypothetical protein